MKELEKRDLGTSEGFTFHSKSLVLRLGLTRPSRHWVGQLAGDKEENVEILDQKKA